VGNRFNPRGIRERDVYEPHLAQKVLDFAPANVLTVGVVLVVDPIMAVALAAVVRARGTHPAPLRVPGVLAPLGVL